MYSSDDSFVTATDSDNSFLSADESVPTLGCLLNDVFSPHPKNFNVCHINAQSIPAHFTDLLDAFSYSSIHAVLVSESWLKPSLPSTSFPLPNCVLIRNDRTGKGGGGVSIYLKSHLPYKIVLQSPSAYSSSPEYLFIEVDLGIKFLLGVVYCPPNIDYFSKLEGLLENLLLDYNRVLIMGDFNTCLMKQDTRSHKLSSLVVSSNLNFLDLAPTHHSHTNDSLLDLIITTEVDLISTHGQMDAPGFSHHDLIYASLKIRIPKPKAVILNQRNFARMNLTELDKDASSTNWAMVENLDSVDEKIEFLRVSIINIFDRHAPLRPVKLKHKPSPWLNDTIRKAMKRRNQAFRKYKQGRNEETWEIYKKFRNRCNMLCRNAKRRHIAEQIELSTPAGIWKFLRSIGIGKPKSLDSKVPCDLNSLNVYFTSCTSLDPAMKLETLKEIENRPHPVVATFDFELVSQDFIHKAVQSLKSKAVGSDDIGRVMIMFILKHLLHALAHIINFSLATGCFPDMWRKAHVLPLPKIPNPLLPNHFRPISILPFLSKVIESVVHKQVTEFLTNANLFNTFQSGFRAGHSTTTALLKVTEDIRANMENSQVTILVLIDFSNAFNAVDHDLLTAILRHLNFSAVSTSWFTSYLKGRRQAIRTGQSLSEWCDLEAGVPQGGILSPLLFSLFINMLSPYLHCLYHFYADDLQLYRHTCTLSLDEAVTSLNNDLNQLLSWSKRFGIDVNPNKCQAIIIGSPRQLCKINYSNLALLKYNGSVIPFSSTVKDLGILIDSNLSWTAQLSEVSRKFYASLHSIIRFKNFLPCNTKISLVNTLLLPIIDYADICCLDLTEELLNKLERLLNTCIRFIFGLRKFDHISEHRSKLKWLKIRDRRNARILGLLFSILNDPKSPSYLKDSFTFLSDTHERTLRSTNALLLCTPKHSSSVLDNSFGVVAVRLWNELPLKIKKAPSKDIFKRLVREHFLGDLSSTN